MGLDTETARCCVVVTALNLSPSSHTFTHPTIVLLILYTSHASVSTGRRGRDFV